MTQDEEILKIEIPVEEEAPFVPEPGRTRTPIKEKVARTGKTAAQATGGVVKKAWDSEPRRKVTRGVAQGAKKAARKSGRFLNDKVAQAAEREARERATAVQTRIKETDWKREAKSSTSRGLRWLSDRLAGLAARVNAPQPKSGEEPR
jgi:hypothetical protein